MKKDGENCLVGTKLGMEVLYKHILKTDLPGNYNSELAVILVRVMGYLII